MATIDYQSCCNCVLDESNMKESLLCYSKLSDAEVCPHIRKGGPNIEGIECFAIAELNCNKELCSKQDGEIIRVIAKKDFTQPVRKPQVVTFSVVSYKNNLIDFKDGRIDGYSSIFESKDRLVIHNHFQKDDEVNYDQDFISINRKPQERIQQCPVDVEFQIWKTECGRGTPQKQTASLQITVPAELQVVTSKKIKILFLAANPISTSHLQLGEEVRAIEQVLRQSPLQNTFELISYHAVRSSDLLDYLLEHSPDIVHFSGHSSISNEIILHDEKGQQPVSPIALGRLFEILKGQIKCVILNTCYSRVQAEEIAKSIDCVVGVSGPITDDAAIRFTSTFYSTLGYGQDIKTAFDLGCVSIALTDLTESEKPHLLLRNENSQYLKLVERIL